MEKPALVCCAMPYGYGPAAKLLSLAPRLRTNWRLWFVGYGSAFELVKREARFFEHVVEAHPSNHNTIQLLSAASGVLSIMDREFAELAQGYQKPLFVLDSLLWMRPSVPKPLRHATIYWAQNFIGMHGRVDEFRPRPLIVGPLLPDKRTLTTTRRSHLLINLGGCQVPDADIEGYRAYADFVVTAVRDSPWSAQFHAGVTVTAGASCINWLSQRHDQTGFRFRSVAHEELVRLAACSETVLTAPGLTMTLECFRQSTPVFFMPPQNYSQWCILRRLRRHGLAPHALCWSDFCLKVALQERMHSVEYEPLVRRAVDTMVTGVQSLDTLGVHLERMAKMDQSAIAKAQNRFVRSLGPNGVDAVAESLKTVLPSKTTIAV